MPDVRLIDANALKETIVQNYRRQFFGSVLWNILDDIPTIDAVPVVHARWEERPYFYHTGVVCNACEKRAARRHNYCPNCGAKMDGGAEDG